MSTDTHRFEGPGWYCADCAATPGDETPCTRETPRPLTYREVAARLGISHGTVQNIERRALAKLRARLGEG